MRCGLTRQPTGEVRQRKGTPYKVKEQQSVDEDDIPTTAPEQEPPKAFLEEEEFLEFLYKPHTLMGLCLTVSVLAYLAFGRGTTTSEENLKAGILACCIAFLLYCVLQLRDGMLIRPHPIFWRLVNGMSIIYLMGLIFISMLDVDYVRKEFMPFMFGKDLGVEPMTNTKNYATDCRMYTPENPDKGWGNFFDAFFDVFALAHVLGWVAKALLFRDYMLLWVLSLSWEVLEVSFQHLLPNFKECWWDHYLLDVLGCNLVGMLLGMWVCRRFATAKFNWMGVSKLSTAREKVTRVLCQLTPFSWSNYHWGVLTTWKRCFQVILMLAFIELTELNCFMLKHAIWLAPGHYLVIARLVFMWLVAFPAAREYYAYITDPTCRRMGSALWLMLCIGFVETMIGVKFALQDPSMFAYPTGMGAPVPSEAEVKTAWLITITLFLMWYALHFSLVQFRARSKKVAWTLDGLLIASAVPLLYLAVVDFFDTFSHSTPLAITPPPAPKAWWQVW